MAGSQAPYIMPDGSGKRLAQFLTDNVLDTQSKRNGSKGLERKWKMHDSQRGHRDPDVEQLLAVGRGKRRRWLGDILLRKMAGSLTADAMEALFQPVPFGEVRVSTLEQVSAPEHAPIWDMFRSIDPDKQTKVLLKWEAHARGDRVKNGAGPDAAQEAWQRWAAVSRKARTVLKRANPELVAILELSFIHFLDEEEESELDLSLEDSFQRLIAHGLAAFHGLSSYSGTKGSAAGGSVVVRKPKGTVQHAAPQITCADILFALEDQPAGLTPAVLAQYSSQQHRSCSEASYVIL